MALERVNLAIKDPHGSKGHIISLQVQLNLNINNWLSKINIFDFDVTGL